MNRLIKTVLMSLTVVSQGFAAEGPLSPQPAANAPAPAIQFASTVYDFGRVPEGTMVEHSFVFTNTGASTLTISGVHTSCGCTSAGEWSREIPPGATGSIPLQFSSTRFVGDIVKTATVMSNDPKQPSVQLQIKGTVWRPIEITPPTAVLNVSPEAVTNATTVVRVINNLDEPLKLEPPVSNNGSFSATVTEVQPGKEFHLTISTTGPLTPGTHQGTITTKTSSTNMPVIQVVALAIVQQAVVVAPTQVLLTAQRAPAYAVSIRNNGANPLVLSDAAVNAEGVSVEVKEVTAGQQFTILLKFPKEFQVPSDREVALTVKTSHPRHPVIKVPVRQYPPPPAATTRLQQPLLPVPPLPGAAQ